MKGLLNRYGNSLVLLDATYKTCKYAVPLFFLVVKTNVDYQVAATFMPEHETTRSIEEAISVLKEQNPDWKPSHYMTDFDEREMNAMESIFPGKEIEKHWGMDRQFSYCKSLISNV